MSILGTNVLFRNTSDTGDSAVIPVGQYPSNALQIIGGTGTATAFGSLDTLGPLTTSDTDSWFEIGEFSTGDLLLVEAPVEFLFVRLDSVSLGDEVTIIHKGGRG